MIRNKKLQEIDLALNSLVVFRKLMTHDVILPLRSLLDTETMDPIIQLRQYTEFVSRLYTRSTNLTEYIFRLVCEDENFYAAAKSRGEELDEMLEACVQNELAIIQRFARLRPSELLKEVSYYGILPEWQTAEIDFYEAYQERLREIGKYGYGTFAAAPMFTVRDGRCVAVKYPDTVRLSDLAGYETQRQTVLRNTAALLKGLPAQNILLYGDAGTGKSSTVKAMVNEFYGEGLRLIQITKEQLSDLPEILDLIHGNPLKFIVFCDDLTFTAGDDSFSALKAVLEGSVSARARNTVIYATGIREQIVQEQAADAEIGALTARFGLRVFFARPERAEYLHFVREFAQGYGLTLPQDILEQRAEQYAADNGGRSPRAARQITEILLAEQE